MGALAKGCQAAQSLTAISAENVRPAGGGEGVQEVYRETVAAMHDLATQLVQEASIELHSSDRHMETLQAAQQVNEWGSTLCKIAINSLSEGWSLPDLAGAARAVAFSSSPLQFLQIDACMQAVGVLGKP